jgi:hypothetical protein
MPNDLDIYRLRDAAGGFYGLEYLMPTNAPVLLLHSALPRIEELRSTRVCSNSTTRGVQSTTERTCASSGDCDGRQTGRGTDLRNAFPNSLELKVISRKLYNKFTALRKAVTIQKCKG